MNRRQRLRDAISALGGIKQDVARHGQEGQAAAAAAAMWAAVLMVAEILKTTISAMDPKAAAGFHMFDSMVEKADKLLQLFGSRPMTKKADLMKQVDPNLAHGATVVGYIRTARTKIIEATKNVKMSKIATERVAQLDLVARLGIDMADSTILLMQAGQDQTRVGVQTRNTELQINQRLEELRKKLVLVDDAISNMLARYEMLQRTA